MGIIWSTMKVGEGSSKEATTVVIGEDQVYSNKAPSTSTSTIAIGEDRVCSMYEVCDGKTTSMPVTVADLLPFKEEITVFEPAPSDNEAWEAISTIKEHFEPLARSWIPEIGCSSIITPSDSVTSEAKQPLQSDIVQFGSKLRDAIGACCLLETCCAMREMVVGAVKDKTLWDAFMNCESVVQFKTDLSNKIPVFSQALVVAELVGNIQADGNQGGNQGSVDKNMYFKLIIDKAREMVLEVVSKAFDSMEKVFLRHEQQSHQKSKQSCFDPKFQEGSSTSEKIFDTVEHIMRTPFFATLLINTVVFVYRIIRVSLK